MHDKNIDHPIRLALSTGTVYAGTGFGAIGQGIIATGEVVFNTSMTGYQESLTDPSYMRQILVQTQPMMGNTGTNPSDTESTSVQVAGFAIHEYTKQWSNYRGNQSLHEYLAQSGILGIAQIDTRSLTRALRSTESVQGVLTDRTDITDIELLELAQKAQSMCGQNLAQAAGCLQAHEWTLDRGEWGTQSPQESSPIVLVMDFGLKSNIARCLTEMGCKVQIIPQATTSQEIVSLIQSDQAHALFLSNGPGDPSAVEQVTQSLKELIGNDALSNFPIYGICLGHQLLSLAIGATTYKLPFGHRGANHPVHELESGRIQITSQNHGFAVDKEALLQAGGVITHIHLNDHSVAGFRHASRPIAAVQFHPEASPGPHDAHQFFIDFVESVQRCRTQLT